MRFGYTYPETSGNVSMSAMKRTINRLYGSNASVGGLVKRTEDHITGGKTSNTTGLLPNGCMRHYVTNIVSQKFAMNGSYAIYVFLGDFEDNPSDWSLSKNLAGTHAVAASLVSKFTPKSRLAAISDVKVTGAVPLTDLLLTKIRSGELASMDTGTVEAYLSEKLQWRVATVSQATELLVREVTDRSQFDATVIPCEGVAGLSVTIVSSEMEPATREDEFPHWGDFTRLNIRQAEQCKG